MNKLFVPFPTIEAPRLLLRRIGLSDAEAMFEAAKDEEVCRFFSWGPYTRVEEAAAFIFTFADKYETGDCANWGIALKPGDRFIGLLSARLVSTQPRCELDYWLGRDYWGQGYMTEALRAFISFAFDALGLERVQAVHSVQNPASGRVMEKAGMEFEGVLRSYVAVRGQPPGDYRIYAATRATWKAPVV